MAQPTLRPLSVFETIDAAFSLYRKHFKDLIIIAAIILIPLGIISYLVSIPSIELTSDLSNLDPNDVPNLADFNFSSVIGGSLIAAILSVVGTALLTGSATNTVASSYLDRIQDWQESMREALQKLGSLVGSAILLALGVGVGLILCIVPGVYLYVSWVTAPVTIMVEDESATGALGRSRDLVSGRWGSVFGVLVILFILQFIIGAILGAIVGAGTVFGGSAVITAGGLALSQVASTVTQILIQPFLAVVITVVYFDLRVRKEGFDLDQLARRMGGEPPAGGAPGGSDPSGPGPITPPPPPPPAGGDPFS